MGAPKRIDYPFESDSEKYLSVARSYLGRKANHIITFCPSPAVSLLINFTNGNNPTKVNKHETCRGK
ncbi:hypothetical protein Csa_009954 [Cucumis sativus]|uniref:Uncharacterized protein n=1 Tax=Cucumis sativus TaxID=3659 RepID=A0A0A0L7C5_CUCSA|nr:hypothetical protein Csa_009954 [Cucumis sativus]